MYLYANEEKKNSRPPNVEWLEVFEPDEDIEYIASIERTRISDRISNNLGIPNETKAVNDNDEIISDEKKLISVESVTAENYIKLSVGKKTHLRVIVV